MCLRSMGRKGKVTLGIFTFICCAIFFLLRSGERPMFAELKWLMFADHKMNSADKNDVKMYRPRMQASTFPLLDRKSDQVPFERNYIRTCGKPVNNIAFLKTHKTASSSIQNVILRYGVRNHLHFALTSLREDLRFYYPSVFRSDFVRKSDKAFNIICHHMRFNYTEVLKVVPQDSRFITILREPGALFESSFTYFRNDIPAFRKVPSSTSIDRWLNKASEYFTKGGKKGGMWQFAKSGTFFDLGYDNLVETSEYIANAIAELEKIFHLVLIAEYFDTSMILLKELMCWSFDDVVSMKINSRLRSQQLSPSTVAKVREWNKADAAIYDHFNRTFWRKVEKYGKERMEASLKTLRGLNKYWFDRCVSKVLSSGQLSDGKAKVLHPRGVHVKGFQLRPDRANDDTCVYLTMTEDAFSNEISLKQDGHRFR